MKYANVVSGVFLKRPNRFIAHVERNGKEEIVHVKNTGRCKELLQPGARVYLSVADNPLRKTKYDLIAVEKQRGALPPLLVNMDSQIPNAAAHEWLPKSDLFSPNAVIRPETRFQSSRFDFYIEDGNRKAFMEVKGVTLEHDGVASFPDAPTVRGVRHLRELIASVKEGYEAYVLFVVQMKEISLLRPNDETHPEFGQALREAQKAGVKVLAMDCCVTPDGLCIDAPVPVDLSDVLY